MTRILLIGLGGVGQRHARNLRQLLGDDLDLIAYRVRWLSHVVTPSLAVDVSKDVEREYGIRSFATLDAALAEKPSIAFLCNPSSLHIEIAQKCAEHGCDLFIEKPLASSADGVEKLIQTVRESKRVGMVGYQLRYHPCILALGELLKSKRLGSLLGVRAMIGENIANWHPYEDYRTMYAARADLGGGVVLSQIHEFDYLYSLFGMPSKVFAVGGHWSHLEIDVEDAASVLMQCKYDSRPLPIHVHMDYLLDPPIRQCEIIGDQGRAVADLRALTLAVYAPKQEPEVQSFEAFDRNTMFLDEVAHFLDCVATRKQPAVGLEAGYDSLRIALAVKQSISQGRLVRPGAAGRKTNTTQPAPPSSLKGDLPGL